MTYTEYQAIGCSELAEMIRRNSRKPMAELLRERVHLHFHEDEYGDKYCENRCPFQDEEYRWECLGDCREWEEHVRDGQRKVYGADLLIGEILRNGYQALGVNGINKPFRIDDSCRAYANMYWETAYEPDSGICAECEYYGNTECPEDILSAECPKSGDAWAVEHVAVAVDKMLKDD